MPRLLRFDLRSKRISEQSAYPDESALVFTSRPYPISPLDEIVPGLVLSAGRLATAIYEITESVDTGIALAAGSLRPLLQSYAVPDESLDTGLALSAGELRVLFKGYTDWPAEPLDTSLILASGELAVKLIPYTNWPAESLDTGIALAAGSLT